MWLALFYGAGQDGQAIATLLQEFQPAINPSGHARAIKKRQLIARDGLVSSDGDALNLKAAISVVQDSDAWSLPGSFVALNVASEQRSQKLFGLGRRSGVNREHAPWMILERVYLLREHFNEATLRPKSGQRAQSRLLTVRRGIVVVEAEPATVAHASRHAVNVPCELELTAVQPATLENRVRIINAAQRAVLVVRVRRRRLWEMEFHGKKESERGLRAAGLGGSDASAGVETE